MDVYDEVDRRETDAGKGFCIVLYCVNSFVVLCTPMLEKYQRSCSCSVVSYTESQHPGDRDNCGAFPACESRIFINTKPGKLDLQNPHTNQLCPSSL